MTIHVGRLGRPVDEVASELECVRHPVSNEALAGGCGTLGGRHFLGWAESRLWKVDERLFWRQGRWRANV